MLEALSEVLARQGMVPHGYCINWSPGLLWSLVASDLLIGLAYFSIPGSLAWIVWRRHDARFNAMFLLFSLFIFVCGTTHFVMAASMWWPVYWMEAVIKAATAAASLLTAVVMWRVAPSFVQLPTHAQLEDSMREARDSESRLRELSATLEQRVAERTAELELSKRELEASLAQQTALLREVHHRVKNNLQVISSLLNLQANASRDDPAAAAVLNEAQGRVRAIALTHQLLYEGSDFTSMDLCEYLQRLRGLLADIHGGRGGPAIEVACMGEPVRLDLDRAVPCGLVVTELVSNAVKHAFPGDRRHGGRVRIALERLAGGQGRLVVADDGVGLAPSVDAPVRSGLGLQLLPMLAEQMGATFEACAPDPARPGARFELRFDLSGLAPAP